MKHSPFTDPVDLRNIAARLVEMAEGLEARVGAREAAGSTCTEISQSPKSNGHDNNLAKAIVEIYKFRRARSKNLPGEIFGEPAWDILLDLFVARLEGRSISVTSACIAADVPSTTALRWVGILESRGLVSKKKSKVDNRVQELTLTDKSLQAMTQLFSSTPEIFQTI